MHQGCCTFFNLYGVWSAKGSLEGTEDFKTEGRVIETVRRTDDLVRKGTSIDNAKEMTIKQNV